jgi:outer membrane protein assembly factor BamB
MGKAIMKTCHASGRFIPLLLLFNVIGIGTVAADLNWPRWRGPAADGHARETDLPHSWTNDSVTWKTPLPGRGNSSPTIWGERIFLTSAIDQGRQRMVICVDRNNGTILWQHVAWSGQPEPSHEMNGWASATCATDGQRVYAFFGRGGGLHCYTVEGTHLWSRDLGQFTGPWGTAASPLLVGKLVIQNCDADENAYIVAFDKESGEEVWKVKRPNHRGWSSPILVNTGERDEVVVNGHTGVTAYAPDTGEQLWFCACERGRGSPTVTPAGGLLFLANGLSGGGAYCVRPGGSGDVTESRRLWFTRRGGRDLSSPIVIGDAMLIMGLRGAILTCYDTRSGDELWTKRIGGQVSASPISYDGLVFFMVESGDTVVIDPNSEMKIVATNSVEAAADEEFRASITPSDGQLFLRSNQHLYCVGVRKEKETS